MWRNWQTRKIQDLVIARLCRFKSCHPHQTEDKGAACALISLRLPAGQARRIYA